MIPPSSPGPLLPSPRGSTKGEAPKASQDLESPSHRLAACRVVGRAGTDRGDQLHPAQEHPQAETGETSGDAMAEVPWLRTRGKRAEAPRLVHTNTSPLVLPVRC